MSVELKSHPQPLVTICIPAYNAEKTIGHTLDSILNQDYPNIAVLVCDNLSKDKTADIVKEYEQRGVSYMLNSIVGSAENNWNYALDFIKTDFIGLFHADDIYSPTMVSLQVKFLIENPNVCSVFTMSTLINEDGKPLKSKLTTTSSLPECSEFQKIFDFSSILNAIFKHSNFIKTPSLLTHKATFEAVGKFDIKFKSSADLDLWFRMAKYKPIGIINQPLLNYRISPWQGTSVIMNGMTELPDFFKVTENYLLNHGNLIGEEALVYYQMIKGGELILCSMNLLLKNEFEKATMNLKQALTFKNLLCSFSHKRILIRYFIGYLFFIAIHLKMGHLLSKCVNFAYQKDKKKWNRPIKKGELYECAN